MSKKKPGLPKAVNLKIPESVFNEDDGPAELAVDYFDQVEPKEPKEVAPKPKAQVERVVSEAPAPKPISKPGPVVGEERGGREQSESKVHPIRQTAPRSTRPKTSKEASRKARVEISLDGEARDMLNTLLNDAQKTAPQADTNVAELFKAWISVFHRHRDQLDFSNVRPRGRWGTPTATSYVRELSRSYERAVVDGNSESER